MKTLKFLSIMVALIATISCKKESELNLTEAQQSSVTFSVNTGSNGGSVNSSSTKVTGSNQGNQTDDNTVNTLEFFIFNAEGESEGVLDAYKKFTGGDGLTNLEVKATTGAKSIFVVANSHKGDWKGVVTLAEFQKQISNLKDEDNKNFLMVGNIDATLQASTSLTLSISRLVARVCLSGISTSFSGTPYEGMELSNVKVYLTNIHSSKQIYNGLTNSPVLLNNKKLVAEDVNGCALTDMLYDAIPTSIGSNNYSTPHYFYTYENLMESESAENRFTRLVIEAELNGSTYYYPISINQEGFGYVLGNGHKGVKRNTAYTINATILRPGSTNPDEPVEHGVLSCSVNVLDWNSTSTANQEF